VVARIAEMPTFHEHWEDRFQNWADPLRDPFGESYQTLSALNSLGQSAGFGKGIGMLTTLPVSGQIMLLLSLLEIRIAFWPVGSHATGSFGSTHP